MKLTRKEKEKIKLQNKSNDRGSTWVGFRPSTMQSKKYNKKTIRRESKNIKEE